MKKTSTKWITTLAIAGTIFFAGSVKAQTADKNPWRLGIGIEAGIPTGAISSGSNLEVGGTLRLQYDATPTFAYTFTSGYYNFFGKTYTIGTATVEGSSVAVVPLKAGIKSFFSSNLYFGAEAGAGFETQIGGYTKLILSPTLGFANKNLDVGLRYENFSGSGINYGLVSLRLAFAFPL